MLRFLRLICAALGGVLLALLAACSTHATPATRSLSGEAYYLQRIALPPNALFTVTLEDVSRADAPAITLASHSEPGQGRVPLPFTLSYAVSALQAGHLYAVRARIELDGKLLFISTDHYAVVLDALDSPPLRIRLNAAH